MACTLLRQHGFQHKGLWELSRTYASSLQLLAPETLLLIWGAALCFFLSGSPVGRQLRQTAIHASGQGGWFRSTVP